MNSISPNIRGRAGPGLNHPARRPVLPLEVRPLRGQTISTEPLQTIIPVRLNASTGDITVGSTTYKGANPGFHVLALSRQPNKLDAPDLVWDKTYTNGADTFNALVSIRNTDPDALLIVNGVGNYGFGLADKVGSINGVPVGVGWYLGTFGAYSDLAGISGAIPFTFIGVGGANAQTALQRGYGTRDVQGYMTSDSQGNYTFIQTDFVRYDIGLNGDITVGKTTYTVANSYRVNCNGQNAFRMVIVDREDPTISYANNTYCTATSDSEIERFKADINTLMSKPLSITERRGSSLSAAWASRSQPTGTLAPTAIAAFTRSGSRSNSAVIGRRSCISLQTTPTRLWERRHRQTPRRAPAGGPASPAPSIRK